jgi:dehydrogenase/reductase SDR family protein 7B
MKQQNFFQGKIAWVTGASSGIGAELAQQLARNGARVILSARNLDTLEKIKEMLPNTDFHLCLKLDLEDSSSFTELASEVHTRFGKIDFLFNNGGISQRGKVAETDLSVDRRIMEVNYFGNIALTKAVLPYFKKQGSGHFVVVTSIAGKFGFFLRSAYSASKHALYGFYESLMLEEEESGVKVTMVCPGKINTPISMRALNAAGESHGVMDHNQETGMTAEVCVAKILKAVEQNKKDVLIGNREIKAVTLKRFFPGLFWKVIKKQSAT